MVCFGVVCNCHYSWPNTWIGMKRGIVSIMAYRSDLCLVNICCTLIGLSLQRFTDIRVDILKRQKGGSFTALVKATGG